MPRLFLLSPAKVGGVRAKLLLNRRAPFPLARQFHGGGLALGDIFSFASALYFRGKITYARRFARLENNELIRVITANSGLVDPDRVITPAELRAFGRVDIHEDDPRYHKPLRRDAAALARQMDPADPAILLGSIATGKYRVWRSRRTARRWPAGCARPLQWFSPGGAEARMSARVALLRLHRLGLIALPPPRSRRNNYAPVLLESFVQSDRFKGTVYRAANWQCVGYTRGRGRNSRSPRAGATGEECLGVSTES